MPTILILSDDPAIIACGESMETKITYRPDQTIKASDLSGDWRISGNRGTLIIFAHGKMADPEKGTEAFIGDAAGPNPTAESKAYTATEVVNFLQSRIPETGKIYVQACQSADVINIGELPPSAHAVTIPDSFTGGMQRQFGPNIQVKGRYGSPTTERFEPLAIETANAKESVLWKTRVCEVSTSTSTNIEDITLAGKIPELDVADLTLPGSLAHPTAPNSDAPSSLKDDEKKQEESKENEDFPGSSSDFPRPDRDPMQEGAPGM